MAHCPNCKVDLEGDLIYDTFIGKGYSPEKALETAEMYGATKTTGRWDRRIGHYSMEFDRTVGWECPDCGHYKKLGRGRT